VTTTLAALQRALAAEHVAVYAYGAAGARLTRRHDAAALAGLDAHRAALAVSSTDTSSRSAAYAGVLAATDDRALRRLAVNALCDAAARATAWRRVAGDEPATDPLPGLSPADRG